MRHGLVQYCCLILLCTTMFSSAFYLQSSSSSSSSSSSQLVPDLYHIVQSLEHDHHRSAVVKRSSDKNYGAFYRLMARHNRYKDEQAFVEKMFRLFDMNSDEVIERDEFRAILQLLGIISHSY